MCNVKFARALPRKVLRSRVRRVFMYFGVALAVR